MLAESGAEVLAIDKDRDLVEEIRDRVVLAVCLDSTNEQALKAQGVHEVDVAVVGIGEDFESSVLTTVLLKQLGIKRLIVRAESKMRAEILTRIGADDIVNPERESADRWRSRLLAPALMERIELAEGHSLAQVAAPPSFYDRTLEDLALRKRYKVNVVAIRRTVRETEGGIERRRELVISVPMPDSIVRSGDILLLIGSDQAMESLPSQ